MAFDVFHNWAHNIVGPRGGQTKQGNVYFDPLTRIIYSYGLHFPMARFVQNARGETAVAFTRRTYSKSTARHMWNARSAVRHECTFLVPEVDVCGEQPWKEAFALYLADAATALAKAKRSRKYTEGYLENARKALQEAQALSDFAGLGYVVDQSLDDNAKLAELVKAQEEARKEEARCARERVAKQREKDAEAFAKWQAGVSNSYSCPTSYQTDQNGSAYLRTVGEQVQTSLHAFVPLSHAVRAYRFVKLCRMAGRSYQTNGHSVRVGSFVLNSIDTKGNIRVGCHYISWDRINEWAVRQGIANDPASDEALEVTLQGSI